MRALAFIVALAMTLGACGGGDGAEDEAGGRVEVDVPDQGEFLVGGDLDLPEWFPPGFAFVDDLALKSVFADDLTMGLFGETDASIESTHDAAVADLSAAGYELLSDEDRFAVFIRDGVGRVRLRTTETLGGGATGVTVDIDRWSDEQLDELRALSAPEVRTRGMAVASLDGETIEAAGECVVQSRDRFFIADDITISATVDEFAVPPNVYADVTTADGTVFFMDIGAERDYEVTSASPPVAFSVTGVVVSNDAPGERRLTVEVTCEA